MRGPSLILAAVVLATFAPIGAAWATNYDATPITDAVDVNPGDDACDSNALVGGDQCTLRAAVMEANQHPNTANPGGVSDTITVAAGTFTLSNAGANEELAATGDLDITEAVIITGAGAASTTIAGDNDRVFDIHLGLAQPVFISGVTITGGQVTGGGAAGFGGGIRATSSLNLSDAVVIDNHADPTSGIGGGIVENGGTGAGVIIVNSTIGGTDPSAANTAGFGGGGVAQNGSGGSVLISDSRVIGNTAGRGGGVIENGGGQVSIGLSEISGNGAGAFGGGISENGGGSGTVSIVDSTITGNSVVGAARGGGLAATGGGTWSIVYATVAGNTADTAGGQIYMELGSAATAGSIFAGAGPQTCSIQPGVTFISQGHNIDDGASCGFNQAGDLVATDPMLAALANNGGFTQTRALLSGSPAIDGGDPNFSVGFDQRGAPREGISDIGAFEFGALAPGPPFQPPFQPPVQPPPEPKHLEDLPTPDVGKEVNVEAVKGTVLVAIPAGGSAAGRGARASQKGLKFVPLEEARQIPTGSFLDTKRGTVELVSATGAADKTQNGQFTSGIFQVLQSRKKREKGLTELRLKGASFKSCAAKRGKKASAAKLSSRTVRQLKANAKGRFRTRGNHSAATVRGTVWLTADRCDGTLTKVTRGTVAVRDFRRKKTVLVKAGKSYLAKAKG